LGLAPLVGEVLGIERAPIEIVEEGVRHSVRIGDAIDFEVEDIVPFGVETGQPVRFDGMFHPVASNLTMAEATRSKIDAFGIQYEGSHRCFSLPAISSRGRASECLPSQLRPLAEASRVTCSRGIGPVVGSRGRLSLLPPSTS
jgi:hypothetical protein